MEITGTVTNIRYRNDDNGWTVLSFSDEGGRALTAVGVMPSINIGETVTFTGSWTEHPLYGEQIKVTAYRISLPTTVDSVLAYLSSGFIKGVGKSMARMMVDKFGAETLDIIKNSPNELLKISGIGPKKLKTIVDSYNEKIGMQDIVIGMQQLGLSLPMTMRIYKLYGENCVQMVRENPYRLIDDVENIGFKTADKIAFEAGYERESTFRIRAGIKYALSYAASEGNTCLPHDILVMFASNNILGVDSGIVEALIEKMIVEGELAEKQIDGVNCVFLKPMYYLELDSAVRLSELARSVEILPLFDVDSEIARLEKRFGVELADAQREAVKRSVSDGILIVTGGPGTGKTTILRFIIEIMEAQRLELELAAPTGRAAKRISDTTGREARTIHRLLEYNASSENFSRNDEYPLETDVIILDEMSMVDVPLFHSLLKAVAPGTRLIMVGDVDQLPSVGPGNVLSDIVASGVIPVIRLNEIFRQAGRSLIVTNAHLVNNGKMPILSRDEEDFMFYNCPTADIALNSVLNLCADYAYLGKAGELQVLSPMKANALGVLNLNARLQEELNPPSDEKEEYRYGDITFREGDRVMQIKNDYDIEWVKTARGKTVAEGMGVFNGDIGTVMEIDNDSKFMTILFDDERSADYSFTMLEELELAYCISVHKSQGSEFPCVVLPLVSGPGMLFNRNILYTAITRARERVFILGTEECVRYMINNTNVRKRYSALAAFLTERSEGIKA
ncbi:MAG: ATP-dependent RecD-like DNA helicase [Clostridia bacterium]|nr:ATP-dependent RecD-like DNA helicase [Clostridia bacterium]